MATKIEELQEKLNKATERANQAEARARAAQAGAAKVKALADGLGIEESAVNVEAILASVKEGKAARDELIDNYVRNKRLADAVGDTDEEVAQAKEFAEHLPREMLHREVAAAARLAPKGGQLRGSDPNIGPDRSQGQGGTKDLTSPFGNPMLFGAPE